MTSCQQPTVKHDRFLNLKSCLAETYPDLQHWGVAHSKRGVLRVDDFRNGVLGDGDSVSHCRIADLHLGVACLKHDDGMAEVRESVS